MSHMYFTVYFRRQLDFSGFFNGYIGFTIYLISRRAKREAEDRKMREAAEQAKESKITEITDEEAERLQKEIDAKKMEVEEQPKVTDENGAPEVKKVCTYIV